MPNQLLNTGSADFASSSANSATTSYLIPRTLLREVVDAARKKLVLRGLAARVFGPESIPGRTLVIPMQKDASTLLNIDETPEGADSALAQTEFENLTFTPVKYTVRIGVTTEMQEDGIIDLAMYHAELAGYEFADNEEALIVSALDTASTSASHNVANSNATLPISDITAAMQNLEADNYEPTDMIVGVEIANDLRNIDTFNEADKTGGPSAANGQRLVGSIFNMNVWVSNNVSAKLAYVIDRRHAFAIAEKRPVTVERYKEVKNDTEFVNVSQRIAVNAWRDNAVSEITTT